MTTTELLIIPTEMANRIIDEIDQNSFERWKRNGCTIEIKQKNNIRLLLNGTSTENEKLLGSEIFPVLKQTQEFLPNRYVLGLGLLIPNPKCGYVIGKEGKTIQKIQGDFGVEVFTDNGKREPVPEGFARLYIRTSDVDAMRWTRVEIRRLEARSLEFNPYAMPRDSKKRMADGQQTPNERIKLPPFGKFTKEQQMHFFQIQNSSGINWVFDEQQNDLDADGGRFVTLEGDFDLVLGAKKRLAKLITEIEDFQLHSSSIRLSNSPSSGRALFRTVVKVPSPAWRLVIGGGGKTIRNLKNRFGVSMRFLGDNFVSYPQFRSLSIFGHDQMNVHLAREHIEREFVEKNDNYLGHSTFKTNPKTCRKFLSKTDDPNNNIDLIDTNAYGHKTEIGGWESDEDSWAVNEPPICFDFALNEHKEKGPDNVMATSDDESLPRWDDEDNGEEGQKYDDKTKQTQKQGIDEAEKEETKRDEMEQRHGMGWEDEGNTATKYGREETGNAEQSDVVEEASDELFLLIERKGVDRTGISGSKSEVVARDQKKEDTGSAIERRMMSLSDGIGSSCVSADSSPDLDTDEPLQQLIFQPLDRKALACQLERVKATLLGDEHLSRELARTQALLRSKERECEQLRSEIQRLKHCYPSCV